MSIEQLQIGELDQFSESDNKLAHKLEDIADQLANVMASKGMALTEDDEDYFLSMVKDPKNEFLLERYDADNDTPEGTAMRNGVIDYLVNHFTQIKTEH